MFKHISTTRPLLKSFEIIEYTIECVVPMCSGLAFKDDKYMYFQSMLGGCSRIMFHVHHPFSPKRQHNHIFIVHTYVL